MATIITIIGLISFASTAACPITIPPTTPIACPTGPGSLIPASRSSSKAVSIIIISSTLGRAIPCLDAARDTANDVGNIAGWKLSIARYTPGKAKDKKDTI